jgi:hypothetical protein
MSTRLNQFLCGAAALIGALSLSQAQVTPPAAPATPATAKGPDGSNMTLVQATTAPPAPATAPGAPAPATTTTTTTADVIADNGGVGVREFQGDEVGQVLRLLARQAKINMVVSDQIPPNTTVTMRLEDVTALQAIAIIVKAKGLFMDQIDNVYYIKTGAERTAEPTESDSYQFSYSRAKETAPLLAAQLASHDAPQVDERTNTIFYRETRSNIEAIRKFLVKMSDTQIINAGIADCRNLLFQCKQPHRSAVVAQKLHWQRIERKYGAVPRALFYRIDQRHVPNMQTVKSTQRQRKQMKSHRLCLL